MLKRKARSGRRIVSKLFYTKWLLKRSPVRVGATISEINSTQTPKDMVFSQTSLKTQSILKVVELDLLKAEKSQQVNGATGVVTNRNSGLPPPSSAASTSYLEVRTGPATEYPKPEPEFPSAMFHDSDCEFFQDLAQLCVAPAESVVVQSIESPNYIENRAHNTNTLHTSFSPQGWDVFDANSPSAQTSFYNHTPNPLSPSMEELGKFSSEYSHPQLYDTSDKVPFPEEFLDISNLPVVIGDLASGKIADMNPWQVQEPFGWLNTHCTDDTKTSTNLHNTMPFIEEDSLDTKLVSVIPRELESNNVVISEYIINNNGEAAGVQKEARVERNSGRLSVDVASCIPAWPNDISTPEVLSFVEQLEKEKCSPPNFTSAPEWPVQETSMDMASVSNVSKEEPPPSMDYEPITPKTESHADSEIDDANSNSSKKRRDSEDSDETYTPYSVHTPRKYRKRKPSIPIKDMIRALEGSQQLKPTRRGRPPKRRESTVSSVCSIDDNASSISTHELRYRELRDKNNEASKRSRMNRKLKELQMEQLAMELEERNKKLRVRAEILEEMTKKLREAFMSAVSQKKLNS